MNGRPITEEETERIRQLRSQRLTVHMISHITGRTPKSIQRLSDDCAVVIERTWAPSNEVCRWLQQEWKWVQPKKKPKKEPVRRGLATPYYYPRMWSQLPEEERPLWYHED